METARVKVRIRRCNGASGPRPFLQEYVVPKEPKSSMLAALLFIYEELDPTLAFRFGCRFKKCGLCGVTVDGKPRCACLAELRDGAVIEPLRGLPVLRDLVIDRSIFFNQLRELQLFIPFQPVTPQPAVLFEPEIRQRLVTCSECLICQAGCPYYDYNDDSFAGPYVFVKLAQLHFDPRNELDRVSQARDHGIGRCLECPKCRLYCPMGINIFKDAIGPLVAGLTVCVRET